MKELIERLRKNATFIADRTPEGQDSWDDPEDWISEAVQLAHDVLRLLKTKEGEECVKPK